MLSVLNPWKTPVRLQTHFLSGKAVVLNLEGIHVEIAQRIIDYSAGSCYAMRGNLQKITNYIFLVTPPNVDISGDIPELVAMVLTFQHLTVQTTNFNVNIKSAAHSL